jgi:hypothetical protein
MSKIQAMFGARGRRLFDSERTEIDELNAEYAAVTDVHVVMYSRDPQIIGEPIIHLEVGPVSQYPRVLAGGMVRVGTSDNRPDVEVFPERTLVRPKVETFRGTLSGKFVQTYRKKRTKKKEVDFEQTIGEMRALP